MSIASIMSKKVLVTQEDANLASLRAIFTQSKFQHVPVLNSMHQVVGPQYYDDTSDHCASRDVGYPCRINISG